MERELVTTLPPCPSPTDEIARLAEAIQTDIRRLNVTLLDGDAGIPDFTVGLGVALLKPLEDIDWPANPPALRFPTGGERNARGGQTKSHGGIYKDEDLQGRILGSLPSKVLAGAVDHFQAGWTESMVKEWLAENFTDNRFAVALSSSIFWPICKAARNN